MFDDQINNNPVANIPNNLPVGEPEDMFAGVEDKMTEENINPVKEEKRAVMENSGTVLPERGVSALGAGILRPKNPDSNTAPFGQPTNNFQTRQDDNDFGQSSAQQNTATPMPNQEIYKIKEPMLGKGIMKLVVFAVVVAILGGGSWWVYNSFIKNENEVKLPDTGNTSLTNNGLLDESGQNGDVANTPDVPNNNLGEQVVTGASQQNNTVTNDFAGSVVDDQVLFGEPIDKDADGLDDEKESQAGTDPNNWDTDNDQLGDGDELLIWKTNPLNPDSDSDSYLDGLEVKNGYNPLGEGKLFEVPTTEKK